MSLRACVQPATGGNGMLLVVDATIRTATEADGPALRAIDGATWSAVVSPAPMPGPGAPFLVRGGKGVSPADVLVAVSGDGVIAGYAMIGPDLPLESSSHVLEVKGLAVDPSRQGAGLGRGLLLAALEEARARGALRVTIRLLGHNAPARALYESCGFEVVGVLREHFLLDGVYVDDVIMSLELGAWT